MVYVTCKNSREAENISKHLLKKRLIACANIFQTYSIYKWKGRIQKGSEFVILAKTKDNKYSKIKKEAKKIHSYDVPCILKIKVDANKEYKKWVEKEIK